MFFSESTAKGLEGFCANPSAFLHINFHSKNFHELVKETCNLPLA